MSNPPALRPRDPAAPPSTPPTPGSDLDQRRKLAADLDAQGIYPPAWTTATRAPWSKQALYRQTGFHDSSRHFLANGELYERANNPALNPSSEQAAESLKAYLGQAAKPIHEIVPVDQVPLTHPVGRPMAPQSPKQAATMAKLLAEQNVNHETWHQGDPVPPAMQKWITANNYKTSDIYQGPDGWHYQRNERSLESPDVTKLRLAEAARQPAKQAADIGTSPDPANAKVAEKILVDWHKAGAITPAASSVTQPIANRSTPTQPSEPVSPANDNATTTPPASSTPESDAKASSSLPDQSLAGSPPVKDAPSTAALHVGLETVATALDKLKRDEKLNPEEHALLSGVQQTALTNGIDLDLSKLDPAAIRRASGIFNPADPASGTLLAGTALTIPAISAPAAGEALAPRILARVMAGAADFLGATSSAILLPLTAFLGTLGVFSNKTEGPEIDLAPSLLARQLKKQAQTTIDNLPPPTTPVVSPPPPLTPPKDPSEHASATPSPPEVPGKLRPLINVIPLGEGFYTKPTITPGWDTVPDIPGNGILENRKGNEQTIRRVDLCGEEWKKVLKSKGYDVIKYYGGRDRPEHYYPNPDGPNLTGGAWGDYTLYVESPEKQRFTVTFNTYTARADGIEPTTAEFTNAHKLVNNWLALMGNEVPKLSYKVIENYEWLKGVFGMIAKGKDGPENDAEFLKACREQILSKFDENGRLKTRPEVPSFGDDLQ